MNTPNVNEQLAALSYNADPAALPLAAPNAPADIHYEVDENAAPLAHADTKELVKHRAVILNAKIDARRQFIVAKLEKNGGKRFLNVFYVLCCVTIAASVASYTVVLVGASERSFLIILAIAFLILECIFIPTISNGIKKYNP
eukprot:TRINITY_DN7832_c0_g1_i1.p1 TRINITY_DN7832_c0_g1~~TRINITY_DN7832_c0_g1_i1.p1  ORF type:complete len:143 (-),score=13.42 TRINITY_DN7832_c0_g1_i1:10-438(-)